MTSPNSAPQEWAKEFDEKVLDLLGCETDPDGAPNMYLIRDGDGTVEYGIDFAPEVKEIKSYVRSLLSRTLQEHDEDLRKKIEGLKWVCLSDHLREDTRLPYCSHVKARNILLDEVISLLSPHE